MKQHQIFRLVNLHNQKYDAIKFVYNVNSDIVSITSHYVNLECVRVVKRCQFMTSVDLSKQLKRHANLMVRSSRKLNQYNCS